ncbi:MAG: chromosome segregation protein SMC [Alphaproteobacteria bacterium]|nr:chromosome segregation protein SMC [Alphaproteobacteria bacterium]
MANFSRLRLQGFKSFVDKTDLNIGPGLTGIVGPNGCGKSNLVEALTWVMGESSAKRLRGTDMDDVIFNGTSRRPARSHAEVSVILDNHDRSAPPLFNAVDEIEVVRRIERGSGSNYYVNSKPVRARDVQMLFADLGIGAQSAAIVSQGRIAAIINAKPAERRQVLEESAGISGLYARRHEAELKFKAADQNLARLQDVVAGLESQIDSLKRQARQAARYKNISADIKELETRLVLLEWVAAREHVAQMQSALRHSETETAAMMAEVAGYNRQHGEISQHITPMREKQAETAAAWQAQNFELRRLDDEEKQIAQQIKESRDSLQHVQNDQKHEEQTIAEGGKLSEKLLAELSAIHIPENVDEEIANLKLKCDELGGEARRFEENYQFALENSANLRAARGNLQSRFSQLTAQFNALKSRITQLSEQIERKKTQQEQDHPIEKLRTAIEEIEQQLNTARGQQSHARETFEAAQASLDHARQTQHSSREALSRSGSELSALENILKADAQSGFRPILEDIKVDEGFELALSKALGDSVMAALDPKSPAHWVDVRESRVNDSGVRESGLNESALSAPPPTHSAAGQAEIFGAGVSCLAAHIHAPPALATALNFIGFVEQDEDGDRAARDLKAGQSIVSRNGTYWRWDGYRVHAAALDRNAIRLKNKNRLDDLRADHPALKSAYEDSEQALRAAQNNLQAAKQALMTSESSVRQHEQSLASKRSELHRLIEQRAHTGQEIAKLEEAKSIAQHDHDHVATQLHDMTNELAQFDEAALQREAVEVEQRKLALTAAQVAFSEAKSHADSFQKDIARAVARRQAIGEELASLEKRVARAQEHLSELNDRAQVFQGKLDDIANRPDTISQRRLALLDHLKTMENAKNQAADALAEQERALTNVSQNLKQAEQSLMNLRESRAKNQAMLESAHDTLNICHQSIHNQFAMSAEELWSHSQMTLETLNAEPMDRLRGKRDRLVRERDGMGPVNLRADVEMAEVEQALQKLLTERSDLMQAIQELRGAIQKLNREARERLQQAFDSVNHHFQILFTRLFGGGSAHLAFIESDDPLDAALEIYASPPGKSLQSLSLLSGGEKTMASTALIFAMFLTNPAPICVLDEIDAPLDDANVDRVCSMLEEIVQKCRTRFIVITHHRLTMARMDRLYGVTMSERGVSQLVSVDLQQKFDFLEAA